MRVTPSSQISLVGGVDDLSQALPLQMMALLHHSAHMPEACTASGLASPQGEALEMRQDRGHEIAYSAHLILEGAISF